MIKTLYEIMTEAEFILSARQMNGCSDKKIKELAHEIHIQYQLWQRGPLNEETQKPFVKAVVAWKKAGGRIAGYYTEMGVGR